MRCFIAIDIDRKLKDALSDLQRRLISDADIRKGDVKWVSPDDIHLTLKFLGEVKDEVVVEVCNIVKAVTARHKSFELDVESVGHFGGKSARILWVGTGDGKGTGVEDEADITVSVGFLKLESGA